MRNYSFPLSYEKKSEDFKIICNSEEIGVYRCDVSAYPFNRVWLGKQRDFGQTERASFAMLGSDGEITLNIRPTSEFDDVAVRPTSKGIKPYVENGEIKITFPGPGQYSIELDGIHNTLTVFVNPEKTFEINEENTLYFGSGVHIVDERIELSDNQTVFIDEGAILYGSINATDKKNIKIVGYGIIDNSRMQRANEINGCAILDPNRGEDTGNPIFLNRCENVVIDGVTCVDSSGWNIYLDGCINVNVNNIKLIGQWRYNSDGCDFCNCTNGTIKNSYLRTFDDCITVKGFKLNNSLPVENILAENCVMWCDWGRALEVGAETSAPYMKDIMFRDCDIIHGSSFMLDIQQGDRAKISNVHFEDIRLEYSGNEMAPVVQNDDGEKYTGFGKECIPVPFSLWSGGTEWSIDGQIGEMNDIYFKDIKILTQKPMIPQGSAILPEADHTVSGVYVENVTVNGELCDFDTLGVKLGKDVKNVYCNKEKMK